ncbi:MAG: PhzF family phenazine biosynthesis protein [Segniliparus sp.]|uniref:PhzF family phenazine biosynthesis protein n=1 Tax=Segniliparus sp. TaxID=2804064 RepID=UPI003F40A5A3
MGTRVREFAQVDVFASAPYLGNPVAVVLRGEGVTTPEMQRLAQWTNLSETVFVLPATKDKADYRLRIFTPGGELPFAGHPTLGAAHAWLEHGGVPKNPGVIVQECAAGLIDIRVKQDMLSFAAPPTLRSGPLEDDFLAQLSDAFGLFPGAVVDHQWVDNGPGWAVVRLSSADEVLDLEPDLGKIPRSMVGVIGAYPDGAPQAYEMRTFAPAVGVDEDPVCGSMSASVGQWLTRTGIAPASFKISQGARTGRAGVVQISADDTGAVWVGGHCATLVHGSITL